MILKLGRLWGGQLVDADDLAFERHLVYKFLPSLSPRSGRRRCNRTSAPGSSITERSKIVIKSHSAVLARIARNPQKKETYLCGGTDLLQQQPPGKPVDVSGKQTSHLPPLWHVCSFHLPFKNLSLRRERSALLSLRRGTKTRPGGWPGFLPSGAI